MLQYLYYFNALYYNYFICDFVQILQYQRLLKVIKNQARWGVGVSWGCKVYVAFFCVCIFLRKHKLLK